MTLRTKDNSSSSHPWCQTVHRPPVIRQLGMATIYICSVSLVQMQATLLHFLIHQSSQRAHKYFVIDIIFANTAVIGESTLAKWLTLIDSR
ncbi:hypothetical protein EDC04DRAFT_1015514 [Pisolithus marmoratus]|nr:hypothetical protein EDC04DRAFT_1015514 [Pisolithus marmoratus]